MRSEIQDRLNEAQKQHLLSSSGYADKLLSDVEAILHASGSNTIFPKYQGSLSPPQIRVVEDYIRRIRGQVLRSLQSQGITPPEPAFGTVHSIRVTLAFAGIAFDECTADRMRGYGEVPSRLVPELNGLVNEIKTLLDQLSAYLAQGIGQDLGARLDRLTETGDEVELLRKLERAITAHGLVEFRGRLTDLLERLESKTFEIALFGRVSSGKSSLLNHIIQTDVLPVGVNPITAVPTRIAYGPEARLLVRTPGRDTQVLGIERLPEFATEEYNPANEKRVERLLVQLPSPRLKDGVVLVDTPGLGSLASAGAAEALAYLPRCDLGVVLIDAGSTLTAEDLSTIQALYQAAIPALVLLSKADLLPPEDRARAREYIHDRIQSHLHLDLAIHAVSIQPEHAGMLEEWFAHDLAPLYEQHQRLTRESLKRKIGALRDAAAVALRMRQERSGPGDLKASAGEWNDAEKRLRQAAGRFDETRERCYRKASEIRESGPQFLREAADQIVNTWRQSSSPLPVSWESLSDLATAVAAEQASAIRAALEDLARDLAIVLKDTSRLLGNESGPLDGEFTSTVQEMPRIDIGSGTLDVPRPFSARLSRKLAALRIHAQLRDVADTSITTAFSSYGGMLEAWTRRVMSDLQRRFNSYADGQRTQLARLAGGQAAQEDDAQSIGATLGDIGAGDIVDAKHVPVEVTG